jgi:hypothetical protein
MEKKLFYEMLHRVSDIRIRCCGEYLDTRKEASRRLGKTA